MSDTIAEVRVQNEAATYKRKLNHLLYFTAIKSQAIKIILIILTSSSQSGRFGPQVSIATLKVWLNSQAVKRETKSQGVDKKQLGSIRETIGAFYLFYNDTKLKTVDSSSMLCLEA